MPDRRDEDSLRPAEARPLAPVSDPFAELTESQRRCLGYIRRRGECTREAIQRTFGWTTETISRLLKPLVDSGLLLTRSRAPRTGGRRRRHMRLHPERLHAIGIEINFRYAQAALVDLGGTIRRRTERLDHTALDPATTLERIALLVAELTETETATGAETATGNSTPPDPGGSLAVRPPVRAGGACGVGVSFAGSLEHPDDASHCFPGAVAWEHVPLRRRLEKSLGLPVEVLSDSVAGTLAEIRFGDWIGCDNLLYLHMLDGIGLGIVLNGVIHTGARNLGGEFGHLCIRPDGPYCYCGATGCLEAVASSWAMGKRARERIESGVFSRYLAKRDPSALTLADLCRAVGAGDRFVQEILDESGQWLGVSLANVADLLDPEAVALGGVLADDSVYGPLVERLLDTYRRSVHFYRETRIEPRPSRLGADAYLLGAAAAVFERLLPAQPPQLETR